MPIVKSTAMSVLVTVYNLAKAKFSEIPYPTVRPKTGGNPFIQNSNPPPCEDIPNVLVREATPWPSTGSTSENMFKARKDWPIPPTPARKLLHLSNIYSIDVCYITVMVLK